MVDDNLVNQLLTEWLMHFGTREVSVVETADKLGDTYNNNDLWAYVVDKRKFLYLDTQCYTWQLTDAGVKHLQ